MRLTTYNEPVLNIMCDLMSTSCYNISSVYIKKTPIFIHCFNNYHENEKVEFYYRNNRYFRNLIQIDNINININNIN